MKPVQLVLIVAFAIVAFGAVAWLGKTSVKPAQSTGAATVAAPLEVPDLPLPTEGPFGKAIAAETSFNFGTVEFGSKGSHVFTIKNDGQGPLRVKTGKTSCGQCTVGEASRKDDILPGETVNIEVKWEIKSPNSLFRQWAEVFTTDPDHRRLELAIEGTVEKSLNLVPEGQWEVGDLSQTEPSVVRGAIYSNTLDEIVIERAECKNPNVSVKWEPASAKELEERHAKSMLNIEVTIAAGSPLGILQDSVTLHSPINGGTALDFSLKGQRTGPVEMKGPGWNAETNTLVMGEFPAAKGAKAKLFFYVRGFDEELEVKEIVQQHNSIVVRPATKGRPIGKSKVYEIEVEVPPGAPVYRRGREAEEVELILNHPEASGFKMFVSYHAI